MANISDYIAHQLVEPPYYQRQFEHDLPEASSGWGETAQRVVLLALPFLSLCQPLGFGISVGMGGCRSIKHLYDAGVARYSGDILVCLSHVGQLALAVMALAGTLFNFQVGLLATTLFDTAINLVHTFAHLWTGEYAAAFEQLLQLISSILYIAIMITGSLEVALASLLLQALISFYQARTEWMQGRWPEFAAKLAMGAIRLYQAHGQLQLIYRHNLVIRTITALNNAINKAPVSQENQRLIAIAKKLSADLVKFIPYLKTAPVPGCCLYEGDNYLANVVAIAEKQERVGSAVKYIKSADSVDQTVSDYFQKTLKKLQSGINAPLPDYFHATREGLESIIKSQNILQSKTGYTGPGTYISCNNEGDHGYGSHAFGIDEGCLVDTVATFRTGRHPITNVFFSLWASVLKDIPVTDGSIAFIDTSASDVPYVKALLKEQNLNIEVVDRNAAENILRIFDLTTERRELPSFSWKKHDSQDYLPQNMYPRSPQGTFRRFMFGS